MKTKNSIALFAIITSISFNSTSYAADNKIKVTEVKASTIAKVNNKGELYTQHNNAYGYIPIDISIMCKKSGYRVSKVLDENISTTKSERNFNGYHLRYLGRDLVEACYKNPKAVKNNSNSILVLSDLEKPLTAHITGACEKVKSPNKGKTHPIFTSIELPFRSLDCTSLYERNYNFYKENLRELQPEKYYQMLEVELKRKPAEKDPNDRLRNILKKDLYRGILNDIR